ncbi:MAG TPA: AsnC family protein [Azospirillum sp.]|nr:AsnC family protein [Azospirillum sp.]
MELMARERLLGWLRRGLPLVERPYLAVAEDIGASEDDVIAEIARLTDTGAVSRFGVIVDHQALGYTSNAMVVWDIPDDAVDAIGDRLAGCRGVSLCYQRPRRGVDWPYNLFTMIHGRCPDEVRACVDNLAAACGLKDVRRELLFTVRRFKQTAPCYGVRRA